MWQVRLESVKVLDKIGEEETIAPLIYAIDDPNILVSDAAAEALGKRKERRAVGSLIKAIKNRDFPYAVKALGEIGDERAIKPLLEELKNEERANKYDLHTSYVKEALIKIGRQVVPYVIDELKKGNKSFKIKRHMIEILGEIGDNRAVLVLIEIVEENIPGIFENGSYAKVEKWEEYIFIKMDAAEALGNIGDERAIPCIEELSKKYVVGPNQIGMSFRIECDRALKKIISNKKLQ
jgi:HEAT repeat protein